MATVSSNESVEAGKFTEPHFRQIMSRMEAAESAIETPTEARAAKIRVRLSDGKARSIQSMTATSFWSADGRPMSAAQFVETLYGTLPEFFKDDDELRRIWSVPDTRKALLAGLADKGFGREPLAEIDFVLAQHVRQEVDELDAEKLSPLLKLKYKNAISDAFTELGQPDQVRAVFVGVNAICTSCANRSPTERLHNPPLRTG